MILRIVTGMLMAGGLAGTLLLVPEEPSPAPVAAAPGPLPEQFVAAQQLLLELRRAWNPNARARLLAHAAARAEEFAAGILWVLQRPDHDLIEPAVQVAGAWRLPGCLQALRQLAPSVAPQLRPQVVRAADAIEPWADPELAELLADTDSEVVHATLAAATARAEVPWLLLFELLDHADPTVRDALVAAVPPDLPERFRAELRRHAESFDPVARATAARALHRTAGDGDALSRLLAALDHPDAAVRQSALRALAEQPGPLADPARIWAIVGDTAAALGERALALTCVERTRSFAAIATRDLEHVADPVLRYFAARCLISCGDGKGARMLIELLDLDDDAVQGVDADLAAELRRGPRAILGQLSGKGPFADAGVYEDWCAWNAGKLHPQRLPPAQF